MTNEKYFKRLKMWLDERFPLMNFVSGAFIYLLAKSIYSLDHDLPWLWEKRDLLGLLVPMTHLFLLRVFDEHKDFETDKIHYPQRVVQRGVFTLSDIRKLGIFAFGLQLLSVLLISLHRDVMLTYVLMWFWTFLMTKEFFMKEWLKKSLFLYGLTHLVVTPLIFLCALTLAAGEMEMSPSWLWALAIAFVTGWIYEISRKTKGAEEETGDMSYSKLWGRPKACFIIFGSVLFTHVLIYFFFLSLGINMLSFYIGSSLLIILTILSLLKYKQQPSAKTRKANEGVMGLTSLYAFIAPIVFSFL